MNRRDIVIIGVLLNIAVLSVLFLTATRPGDEEHYYVSDDQVIALDSVGVQPNRHPQDVIQLDEHPHDELDVVLQPYLSGQEIPILRSEPVETVVQEESAEPMSRYREVTVKRGDVLEKIARANGTTVKELKRVNHLVNDRLTIGQLLRIPEDKIAGEASKPAVQEPVESQYYTVKAGDNPWKIARQNKVNLEDLLRLNGLTEESARNLKVGDTIRVR